MEKILQTFEIEAQQSGVCGKNWLSHPKGEVVLSTCPTSGKELAKVIGGNEQDYEQIYDETQRAFQKWRLLPAPQRGEIMRQMGEGLRQYKEALGQLVSLEMGKILSEGLGEVQEMIDITDFSVGLSRQLYGLTMHSERPFHRMYEQWQPLGVIGIISAFNFPVAVWSWNAMIAAVCGNSMIWKPSEKAPLCSIAIQKIIFKTLEKHDLTGLMSLINGAAKPVGIKMVEDKRIPLISATGSCRMGRQIAQTVHQRLGKTILELGGNNAIIVMPDADLDLAERAVVFGAVGTAGQRCTTTRRLYVHESIYDVFKERLQKTYKKVTVGDPLESNTLMGPLIDQDSVNNMMTAIDNAMGQGGKILSGGGLHKAAKKYGGFFVEPTLIEAKHHMPIVKEETFAPILYIMKFSNLDEAINLQNDVPQGLSSAIFTKSIKSAETFLSATGSDCGIANVNIGTSGAEIGGAFGGEKDTGGGREAGSDSWKAYMRRQTTTINWGDTLPLAQGIEFKT